MFAFLKSNFNVNFPRCPFGESQFRVVFPDFEGLGYLFVYHGLPQSLRNLWILTNPVRQLLHFPPGSCE